jgi:hypothetical protein
MFCKIALGGVFKLVSLVVVVFLGVAVVFDNGAPPGGPLLLLGGFFLDTLARVLLMSDGFMCENVMLMTLRPKGAIGGG